MVCISPPRAPYHPSKRNKSINALFSYGENPPSSISPSLLSLHAHHFSFYLPKPALVIFLSERKMTLMLTGLIPPLNKALIPSIYMLPCFLFLCQTPLVSFQTDSLSEQNSHSIHIHAALNKALIPSMHMVPYFLFLCQAPLVSFLQKRKIIRFNK